MVTDVVRILLIADTHLGLDLPVRPRVTRRRRGPDFFANFERSLEPALEGEVDLVVHGGDLFDRSKVPMTVVEMALAPMVRVAEVGVPVFIVPGNHERRRIPNHLWTGHPNINIFDEPRTFAVNVRGITVLLAGFPSYGRYVREDFPDLVKQTGFRDETEWRRADASVLCIHDSVEGSQVGASDFTFRYGRDVIRGSDIPGDFAVVLAGHIHRYQLLTHDLAGRQLPAPVVYPGSVERTAITERFEDKGYVIVEIQPTVDGRGQLSYVSFERLPTRPMVNLDLDVTDLSVSAVTKHLKEWLGEQPSDAVVRIRLGGRVSKAIQMAAKEKKVREMVPDTMNVSVRYNREAEFLES